MNNAYIMFIAGVIFGAYVLPMITGAIKARQASS